MRTVPVTKDAILQLSIEMLMPILPLARTLMPLEDLLKKLLGVIF